MSLQHYLVLFLTTAFMSATTGPALADVTSPTLSSSSLRAQSIESVNNGPLELILRIDGKPHLLPPTAGVRWENGSAASQDALIPGMRVRVQSHMQGEVIVIDQLIILPD